MRHCATPLNEERKYQGHEDVGLSEDGRAMARAMGQELAARGIRPDRVWSSDLRRAWETTELVFPGVRQDLDARLRELDFGDFGGRTYHENLEVHGDAFRGWLEDPDAHPPPGGERLSDLWSRAVSWASALPRDRDAVAVLHVGSLKAVVSWALGQPFTEVIPHHLPLGAVVELEVVGDLWQAVSGWDPSEEDRRPPRVPPRPGRGAAWPRAGGAGQEEASEAHNGSGDDEAP